MIVDYHMHLRNGREEIAHDTSSVEPFVEAAHVAGVDEIGFTEHVYYFRQTRSLWTVPYQAEREPRLLDAVGVEEGWRLYFDALIDAARSGLFDSLSHPDLVKIFGARAESFDYGTVVDAIAEAGVAIEVSTAGLRKPVRELYPHPDLLAACRKRGVPVTLASDAHSPDLVGRDFDRACELLRSAGYDTLTVFERRQARQEPLG